MWGLGLEERGLKPGVGGSAVVYGLGDVGGEATIYVLLLSFFLNSLPKSFLEPPPEP